ncbi:MAG: hypothetical protein ACOX8H_04295 [Ruminococcus sp.]|jgi:hypothetical protein
MKGNMQSLNQYQKTHKMDQETVLQMGIDICQYLKRGVPHGEIRSSSILVSEDGEFVLKEENLYMDPDPAGDVYALGMLMYRLLNHGRLPFMPPYPKQVTQEEKEQAINRCLSGETLPDPADGGQQMGEVLRKACHADRSVRFQTARELETALNSVLEIKPVYKEQQEEEKQSGKKNKENKKKRESGKKEKKKKKSGISMPSAPSFSLGQIGRRGIFVFLSLLLSLVWIIMENRMTIAGTAGMMFYGYCLAQGILLLISMGAGGMFLKLLWGVSFLDLLFVALYDIVLEGLMNRYGVSIPDFYHPGYMAVILPLAAGIIYFAGNLLKGGFGYGQARLCTLIMTAAGIVMLFFNLTGIDISFFSLGLYPYWCGVVVLVLGILAMENEWSGSGVKLLCFLTVCISMGVMVLNGFWEQIAAFGLPAGGIERILLILMILCSAAAWFLLGRGRNRRGPVSN